MGGAEIPDDDPESGAEVGSLRLCGVSRTHKPPEDLVRFVAGPDRTIVPDLARRLPGRGVWIEATHAAVAEAVRRKAFARSLKQAVQAAEDLPDLVGRLMQKRLVEAVSLARKAGLVVAGFAKVDEQIEAGLTSALIHASGAAPDGMAKLDRKFKGLVGDCDASARIIRELTEAELSLAMGRSSVIHAAAAAGGASRRLIEEARRLRRYRGEAPAGCVPATQHKSTQDVHD
jgi:predicted RNA-binding protein YlxR (DUF448 family)